MGFTIGYQMIGKKFRSLAMKTALLILTIVFIVLCAVIFLELFYSYFGMPILNRYILMALSFAISFTLGFHSKSGRSK